VELLYDKIPPCEGLRNYVSSIWVQQTPVRGSIPSPTRVIPSGYSEMTFFYLNPIWEIDSGGAGHRLARSTVNGQKTTYKDYYSPEDMGTIIVRFRPGALRSFIPAAPSDLIDRNIDLKDIFPPPLIGDLEEQILGSPTVGKKIGHIEAFLINCLKGHRKEDDPLFLSCLHEIGGASGIVRVGSLARLCGRSERSIEIRFRNQLGLPPKRYESIIRFQRALSTSVFSGGGEGFYDQSHFIRAAKRYTGQIPTMLELRKEETRIGKEFNGSSPLYNTVYIDCGNM